MHFSKLQFFIIFGQNVIQKNPVVVLQIWSTYNRSILQLTWSIRTEIIRFLWFTTVARVIYHANILDSTNTSYFWPTEPGKTTRWQIASHLEIIRIPMRKASRAGITLRAISALRVMFKVSTLIHSIYFPHFRIFIIISQFQIFMKKCQHIFEKQNDMTFEFDQCIWKLVLSSSNVISIVSLDSLNIPSRFLDLHHNFHYYDMCQ